MPRRGVSSETWEDGGGAETVALKYGALRRTLPWVRAALLGAFVVTLLGEIGYGSFTPALLLPGVIVGSLAGVTARAVRLWRSWLGTGTVWVLVAAVWGALTWVLLKTAPRCPLENEPIRCSSELAATWSVNMSLAVAVLMLLLEPPRLLARTARAAWRAKGRKREKHARPVSKRSVGRTVNGKNTTPKRSEPVKKRGARDAR